MSKMLYRRGTALPKTQNPLPIRVRQQPQQIIIQSVEQPTMKMFVFDDEFYSFQQLEDLGIAVADCRPAKIKLGTKITMSDGTEFFIKERAMKEMNSMTGKMEKSAKKTVSIGWTNPLNGKKKSFTETEFKLAFSESITDLVMWAYRTVG